MSAALALLLGLLAGYAAGWIEGRHQERRRLARTITNLTKWCEWAERPVPTMPGVRKVPPSTTTEEA